MSFPPPATNPLALVLFVLAIVIVVKSPRRMATLGRMVVVFLLTVLLIIIPGAILRVGDPQAWGRIAALLALLTSP
jgi:hypothetical protein